MSLGFEIWLQKESETCTLKTEQCDRSDSKATERQLSSKEDKSGYLIVEQHPEGWRVTITISKICEACIIHENSYLSEENRQSNNSKSKDELIKEPKVKRLPATKGQAEKSARGMPWHQEPMKDVTSCDKPRVGANILWCADFRMGQPTWTISM